MLNRQQFREQLRQKAQAAYDRRADRFLDYMDRRGEATRLGIEAQTANLERLLRP